MTDIRTYTPKEVKLQVVRGIPTDTLDRLTTARDIAVTSANEARALSLQDFTGTMKTNNVISTLPEFNIQANVGVYSGAKGNGVADDSTAIQAIVDYLETLGAGVILVPPGDYCFTGIVINRPISFKATCPGSVRFINNGTGRMLSYNYWNVGLSDVNKRNWTVVENITFVDSAPYTGTGIYAYHTISLIVRECFFKDFRNGHGMDIEEGLWFYSNHNNTDKSPVRITSSETPHNSNVICFSGGEYRNPTSYGIRIYNGDVISLSDLCVEGYSGTPTAGIELEKVRMCTFENVYAEHIEGATYGAVYTKDCSSLKITAGLLGTSATTHAIYAKNTNNIEIDKTTLSNPMIAEADCGHIIFNGCIMYGKTDIADGVYYEINSPEPSSAVVIPINPLFQSDNTQYKGIQFSNRYTDSSFRTGIPTVTQTVGTPTAVQDTTVGYYDNNSLRIDGVANDKALIQNLGRIEALGQGAIISFMAKAETAADFTFSPSIAVASGGATTKVTTTWRRHYVVSLIQGTQTALANVSMWVTFSNTNKLWIDDVQVTPINSYAEVPKYIDNFRYIYTHGSMILNDDKTLIPYAPYFDMGIQLRKYTYAPQNPVDGGIYYADGTGWNPGGTGAGLYWYNGTVYAKL